MQILTGELKREEALVASELSELSVQVQVGVLHCYSSFSSLTHFLPSCLAHSSSSRLNLREDVRWK